jgi:hypothetical protein
MYSSPIGSRRLYERFVYEPLVYESAYLEEWATQMAHGPDVPTLSVRASLLRVLVASCLRATHRHPELGSGS